ncbi:MAG: hypothetical protein ABSG57_04105 [Candidatus Bathyarchaeia archaeon]
MTSLLCRLGLHKWKNYGEVVKISWKEPGFVPSTTEKIEKFVHSERMCLRCGIKERRRFAENRDGSQAAIGWERINNGTQNSTQ